jgi:hypothetical protein
MYIPIDNELITIELVFYFFYKNPNFNTNNAHSELGIEREELKHILLNINETNDNYSLNLFKSHVSSSGHLHFLNFNNIQTEKFLNNGGFRTFFKKLQENATYENRKRIAEIENLENGAQLSKFMLKTKYLPHILSIIGLIFSIISLYLSYLSNIK